MDSEDVERLIETEIENAEATVSTPRVPDHQYEDQHFAAVVISPAFEEKSLVKQHEMVFDALGEHMTQDVHAMEVETYTPEAYDKHGT